MSPIFVRPVREQLEHDRLIRFLQARYKKKHDVEINVGDEQVAPVKIGQSTAFPDLVLMTARRVAGIVEVETGESVNYLEVMAEWVPYSKARVPFHLYVPVSATETARRLSEVHAVRAAEIWSYRGLSEGFDLVRVFHDPSAAGRPKPDRKPAAAKRAPRAKPARPAKAVRTAARARPAKPKGKGARTAKPAAASRKGKKKR